MMHRRLAALVRLMNEVLASPWSFLVALAAVLSYFLFGQQAGLPKQPIDLHLMLTFTTFVLVFILEHNGARDRAAVQVKLDELLRAIGAADSGKIGVEELHPDQIDEVRETGRREGRRTRDS
ncbi:MAG TPA: low affinity iron permease family protein [Candidatus Saccharimonadales bacterium]|nr:low affinity iron permease family protein [Candidatus Saccharimonadales bacterium]